MVSFSLGEEPGESTIGIVFLPHQERTGNSPKV